MPMGTPMHFQKGISTKHELEAGNQKRVEPPHDLDLCTPKYNQLLSIPRGTHP